MALTKKSQAETEGHIAACNAIPQIEKMMIRSIPVSVAEENTSDFVRAYMRVIAEHTSRESSEAGNKQ